ncbi:MAG: hypothetical protein JXR48_15135 [Candidatus Delongbacteria bacterium]|nr:hypothetical protein [Candidatus Delongbacteria bacterium]MBN2836291.1 hypothetical protein [Candidatus Delongbacteria bacterium]
MKRLVLYTLLLIGTASLFAEEVEFSVKNYLKYGDGKEYAGEKKDIEFSRRYFENWMDLNISKGELSIDLRLEAAQKSQKGEEIADLTKKSITYEKDNLKVTAGDFYTIFGRGVVLDLREEKANFFDNKIFGGKAEYYSDFFTLQAIGGKGIYRYVNDSSNNPADHYIVELNNTIYGSDVVFGLSDMLDIENGSLSIGGSYLFMEGEEADELIYLYEENFIEKTEVFSANVSANFWDIDFYNEYAVKSTHRSPRQEGWANYTSLSYFGVKGLSLTLEYKDYYKFGANPNIIESSFTPYQNPAQVVIDHTAHLLKNNPHVVNANDEIGFQFQLRTSLIENFDIALITAMSSLHDENSLIPSSDDDFLPYFDNWLEVGTKIGKHGLALGGGFFKDSPMGKNSELDFGDIEDGSVTNYERITGMMEFNYELSSKDGLKFGFEGQSVNHHDGLTDEDEKYEDYYGSIEYAYPEYGYVNVSIIKTTEEVPEGTDDYWLGYEIGYNISENHKLELYYGRERAGIKCSGGSCRQVPEFDGFKLSLVSSF